MKNILISEQKRFKARKINPHEYELFIRYGNDTFGIYDAYKDMVRFTDEHFSLNSNALEYLAKFLIVIQKQYKKVLEAEVGNE